MEEKSQQTNKSERALIEERVLEFWKENAIFEKTLAKDSPKGEFVFYEGPPTANAKPALHHLEARVFKDVIPRYKTMQGFHVRRRAGWDTHGLPVELQIEKKLGLASKKDIEAYGIAAFNKECRDSVFTYIKDWEIFTDRIGYWVDKKDAYYTFNTNYIESLWNILATVNTKDLLYKDYKVVPWCPRCGTTLSSHELGQPDAYKDVKDLSVYAKFKVKGKENTYLVAWTTTPWTLPGNVALAVGNDIEYLKLEVPKYTDISFTIKQGDKVLEKMSILNGIYIVSKKNALKFTELLMNTNVTAYKDYLNGNLSDEDFLNKFPSVKGKDLVGLEYEPLYPHFAEQLSESEKQKLQNAYKVYAGDFVTTTDGTGIVHIAPMYGVDDFTLATTHDLPKYHVVDETGHFIKGMGELEGLSAKDREDNGLQTSLVVLKYLQENNLFFHKEKYEHSYPHCWRCKTPLLYYARDSWYIAMSKLRAELMTENSTINWEPAHTRDGRFGEWLREIKDWAISRERYWGTPLPIWESADGERLIVDSIETLKAHAKRSGNTYIAMRHGEAEHNLTEVWSCTPGTNDALTEKGRKQVTHAAEMLKGKVDIIVASPFSRAQDTALLVADVVGIPATEIITDPRVGEWNVGSQYDQQPMGGFFKDRSTAADRYQFKTSDGESYADVFTRTGNLLYELEKNYRGKKILVVTHGGPARAMELVSRGFAYDTLFETTREYRNFQNADVREVSFVPLPHNENYELDLHRPYIDNVVLEKDGKRFRRVKEVMDVWFDSGSMPFAQDHYPFEHKELLYPADFISEAIDQTRGWFYTMHAIGVLMGKGKAYRNVICLGHILDAEGKKMSKSIGNIVDPWEQIEKYGADALRLWMYAVNQPGDSKNYDEKTVVEINRQVFGLLYNVLSFYELYRDKDIEYRGLETESENVLDQWIIARLNQLISETTDYLDHYKLFEPVRTLRDFVDDLSTWYLRRSRERIKDGDENAKYTLYTVLKTLAIIMAPFAPFAAEDIWQKLKIDNDKESVHLSKWPESKDLDTYQISIFEEMTRVRNIATHGNAERKRLNLPTRQPLSSITALPSLSPEAVQYNELIKEELNVENFIDSTVNNEEIKFDTLITPKLKVKGQYRELVRSVQDLRKAQGLLPSDSIELVISEEAEPLVAPFMDEFKKTVQVKSVSFVKNDGQEIVIDGTTYSVQIKK